MARESRPADDIGFQAFQLLISFILTLPLAAHWVALWLGWRIFFLADPHIQAVWATILQAAGAWPFARGALRGHGGRRWFDGLLTVTSGSLYGYGLFVTFERPEIVTHPYFQVQAAIITVVTLDRLVGAVLNRRRVRTQ